MNPGAIGSLCNLCGHRELSHDIYERAGYETCRDCPQGLAGPVSCFECPSGVCRCATCPQNRETPREETMWDLSIRQLDVIRKGLVLLAECEREGNRDGIEASKLADQVDIHIAARKEEARRIVAAQGTINIDLKGR